jgi:hypothetical protein
MQTPTPTAIPGKSPLHIPMRVLDASLPVLVSLLLCISVTARAQQSQSPTTNPPVIPGLGPSSGPQPDPALRRMNEQMVLRRNVERQQQIVSDTAQLLQLAQKLNDEVSKSNKDELSVSVVKEADEIEKLAKTIKEKMRDGT